MTKKANFNETFAGTVVAGQNDFDRRVSINAKAYYKTKVNQLMIGDKVWVTIDDRKPKRSDQQNRLYWLYLNSIAEETGNNADALHELFKRELGPFELRNITINNRNETVKVPKSSTQYTKAEFGEYLLDIQELTGVAIPDTNNYLYGDLGSYFGKRIDEIINYPENNLGEQVI